VVFGHPQGRAVGVLKMVACDLLVPVEWLVFGLALVGQQMVRAISILWSLIFTELLRFLKGLVLLRLRLRKVLIRQLLVQEANPMPKSAPKNERPET